MNSWSGITISEMIIEEPELKLIMPVGCYAVIAAGVAWLIAQIWKTVVGLYQRRKSAKKMSIGETIAYVTRSGGMPSGHAATMAALTTCIGLGEGFDSTLFALALMVTIVIMYDAIHVRYAVGEQGKALNKLLRKAGEPELEVVEGHTMSQVIVGAIIGVIIGVIVEILAKT